VSAKSKAVATSQEPAAALRTGTQPAITTARPSPLVQITQGARAIVPYANYAAQRLGKLGGVGVALCVFSVVFVVTTNSPLREQIASDTATLTQLTNASDPATVPSATPQSRYTTFLNELPTRDDLPKLMNQIVGVSAATGVQLEEGKYELVAAGKAGHIARYRMSFPVLGSYPQVRSFVDQALFTVPAMALDGLSLQRREIGQGVVTAEIDFAVFVRTGT
jgi:Pilus assembly protein, PilO